MNLKPLISFLFVFAAFGCKDGYVSSIPAYPVSLQLNLTASYPTFKNSVNQYLKIEERFFETDRTGFGGIIICSDMPENGNSRYYAYDLACPVEVNPKTKVTPMTDALFRVKCEECNSEYYVGDGFGMPVAGKSKERLKAYRTALSSNGDILYVYR